MSWLDFGWLKRGEEWEFHPWGPWKRGYRFDPVAAELGMGRIRKVRLAMLSLALGMFYLLWLKEPLWVAAILLVGLAGEVIGTAWAVSGQDRCDALGWETGMAYLARWWGLKALRLARWSCTALVAVSLWLGWVRSDWKPYLLAAVFMAVQYFVLYLEQVERRSE